MEKFEAMKGITERLSADFQSKVEDDFSPNP